MYVQYSTYLRYLFKKRFSSPPLVPPSTTSSWQPVLVVVSCQQAKRKGLSTPLSLLSLLCVLGMCSTVVYLHSKRYGTMEHSRRERGRPPGFFSFPSLFTVQHLGVGLFSPDPFHRPKRKYKTAQS